MKTKLALLAGATALLIGACGANGDANASAVDGEASADGQSSDPYTTVSNDGSATAASAAPANPDESVSSDDPPPGDGQISPEWPGPGGRGSAPPSGECPIVGSSGWAAHVNAMPGPNARRTLHVSGKVRVPTAGYRASLRLGPVAESHPLMVTVLLDVKPPSGAAAQVASTLSVSSSWAVDGDVGSVTVRCGGRTVGRVSPVETAH
jgi:hypothetical protein